MERVAATNIGLVRLSFNVGSRDTLALRARIFDTPTGHAFLASCPQHISRLGVFGNEVYGPWSVGLPSTTLQPIIPPGGLAYSAAGQYLCVFFGERPAWPVQYFGQIDAGADALPGGSWRDLAVDVVKPDGGSVA